VSFRLDQLFRPRLMIRAEHGARTLGDLLTSQEKEYGRKIAKAQKVRWSCVQH